MENTCTSGSRQNWAGTTYRSINYTDHQYYVFIELCGILKTQNTYQISHFIVLKVIVQCPVYLVKSLQFYRSMSVCICCIVYDKKLDIWQSGTTDLDRTLYLTDCVMFHDSSISYQVMRIKTSKFRVWRYDLILKNLYRSILTVFGVLPG